MFLVFCEEITLKIRIVITGRCTALAKKPQDLPGMGKPDAIQPARRTAANLLSPHPHD
jgi:hypothetical protein